MIFTFSVSGSLTPSKSLKNFSEAIHADDVQAEALVVVQHVVETHSCAAGRDPRRYTSGCGRWHGFSSTAATDESTPPLRPRMTRSLPICSFSSATVVSTNEAGAPRSGGIRRCPPRSCGASAYRLRYDRLPGGTARPHTCSPLHLIGGHSHLVRRGDDAESGGNGRDGVRHGSSTPANVREHPSAKDCRARSEPDWPRPYSRVAGRLHASPVGIGDELRAIADAPGRATCRECPPGPPGKPPGRTPRRGLPERMTPFTLSSPCGNLL